VSLHVRDSSVETVTKTDCKKVSYMNITMLHWVIC